MFSYTMTVQLEYINHLSKIIPIMLHGIVLNAFSDLLCSKLCWHNWLVPTQRQYVYKKEYGYALMVDWVSMYTYGRVNMCPCTCCR